MTPKINHYCFKGKQTFKTQFRVLVAGGGTGDAAFSYRPETFIDNEALLRRVKTLPPHNNRPLQN
jgi:hypothetical protein